MKNIPFDFKASIDIPNWHKDFDSVIDEKVILEFIKQQEIRIVEYIQLLKNDKKRDLFLLSLPNIRDRLNGYVLAGLSVQNADKKNVNLISTLEEVNFLKTGEKKYLENRKKPTLSEKPLKTYFIRRIVRTLTWTSWWRLPLTMMKPEIIAVAHNEILVQKAKLSSERIFFYQAGELLNRIKKEKHKHQKTDIVEKLYRETYEILIGDLKIEGKYLDRFKYLVTEFIKDCFLRDIVLLEKCYNYKKLPKNIWIGPGTNYSFRLLALAVLRNGGVVNSFAHATGNLLIASYKSRYFGEFAVTNNYADITSKAGELYYKNYLKEFPVSINKSFKVSSIKSNIKFKHYQNSSIRKNTRPTVVYTSNAYRDLSIGAPMASFMAYLKWQLNLTDMLDKMDIDLICQPHPEGIFVDKKLTHTLKDKYNLPHRPFEKNMQKADLFLVDFIHSTTFGEMLVTDRPIVRICWCDNNKFYGISEILKPKLEKRCRNIEAIFNKNGIPTIDEKELEHALTYNWQEKVDSTDFRELLIG